MMLVEIYRADDKEIKPCLEAIRVDLMDGSGWYWVVALPDDTSEIAKLLSSLGVVEIHPPTTPGDLFSLYVRGHKDC